MNELDNVTNDTHHDETHADSSDQLQVLLLGWLRALLDETCAVSEKLHWSVCDLLHVCHCCCDEWCCAGPCLLFSSLLLSSHVTAGHLL